MEKLKQRNGCVNIWLWLIIILNFIFLIVYVFASFSESSPLRTWGMGLLSSLALINILGGILLMRWNKFGFYVLVADSILAIFCNTYFMQINIAVSVTSLVAILIWFGILQIRKNGISAWEQLEGGLDWTHCRHLYQVFMAIAAIIIVITAFNANGTKADNTTQDEATASVDADDATTENSDHITWKKFYPSSRECSIEAPDDFREANLNKDQILGLMCSDYDPAAIIICESVATLEEYGIKTTRDYASLILKNNRNVEGTSEYQEISANYVGKCYLIVYNLTVDGTKFRYYLYTAKSNKKYYYTLVFCLSEYAEKLQPVMEHMAESFSISDTGEKARPKKMNKKEELQNNPRKDRMKSEEIYEKN